MVSDTTKQVPFRVWARRSVAGLLCVTYLLVVWGCIYMGTIPTKYLAVVLPVYGVVTALVAYLLLAMQKLRTATRLWIVLAVALLLCGLNVAGYVAVRMADGLLGGIQSSQTEYVEYVIVARKGENVQVDSAATVGIVQSDPLYARAQQALAKETPATQRTYETLTNLTEGMRNGEVVLGSMRQASWQLVQDNYKEFYDQMTVLATYRVRVDTAEKTDVDVSKPFVLYISGIDTYGDVSTVSRSDVNMLAVINPTTRDILLVNTPRDYYVQLHGTTGTRDKLTHAGTYGIDMSRQTLEDLYGAKIPYYARINFTSLVKIVDTIGPIEVYSDYSFKSYHEGYNTLNSKQALEFARERYSFSEGDRQRGRNQQRVIEAIIAKLNKPQNAVHMGAVLGTVQDSVETNMSEASLKRLIRMQLDELRAWKVESISVDGIGDTQPTYTMGAQPLYVMQPDERSLGEARQRIADTLAR